MEEEIIILLLFCTCLVLPFTAADSVNLPPACTKNDDGSIKCDNAKTLSMASFRMQTHNYDPMTTDQGIPIADDKNSLKAGMRGPTLLEDFILREKITHFDHERIPERVVHARGAAAHGYFQPYASWSTLTRAKFLQDPATITPVFVRFSTVAGSRGSADTVRDIRGFATKFYTLDGNYDIVGNNVPVFFVQDAIKFPDFVHSVKPEPHNEIPQAASAHDTLWDFVAEQTETLHAITWAMSDRAIPRSFAHMDGFGVHTFRLVNATGQSTFVKFHWKSTLGVHSLIWDEAQKLSGKNPDYHRQDLWNQIEAGNYPEYELRVQVLDENAILAKGYDILDPTKNFPFEETPVIVLGKMVLNRNPDNFFAETEQVAFDVANMVPGIDMTDDPLLQGRAFSYLDTQISRLGGVNFHEIPINRPVCPFRVPNNNHRDGIHRQTINIGKTSYDVNTINNGLPMDLNSQGQGLNSAFSYPEPVSGTKLRQRAASFGDHFSQATQFWKSMSGPEQDHIVSAYSFELAKVTRPAIRAKVCGHLQAIDSDLAQRVATNLGIVLGANPHPSYPKTVTISPSLSQANTIFNSTKGRMVAILTASGADGKSILAMKSALQSAGMQVQIIAPSIAPLKSTNTDDIPVDATIAGSPSVLFDAVYIPGGKDATTTLQGSGEAVHYALEAFAHFKPIAISGEAADFLSAMNLIDVSSLPVGVIASATNDISPAFVNQFVANIAMHRFFMRDISMIPY